MERMIDLEPTAAVTAASQRQADDEVYAGRSSRRLKIMMLTVGLGIGGTEGQIRDIATNLNPERFDCLVCALKGEGAIAQDLRAQGVSVKLLRGRGCLDLGMGWRLIRLVRTFRPDIIHAFLPPANVAGGLVSAWCGVPHLVLSCRDLGVSRRWHYATAERLVAGLADAVTCCSDAVRRTAGDRFGGAENRYETLYNGVSMGRFQGQAPLAAAAMGLYGEGMLIGTVCRLEEPTKGLSVLLKAMALLKATHKNHPFRLLIVGDGPAKAELQRVCAQLEIEQVVTFAGERSDVERILPLLDLFVLPSLSEGFGIAIVEAMAAGLPVVASDVGGIPEIVLHGLTGLLVPPGNPEALAQAIVQCMDDPQRRRRFGLQGQARARECFSIQTAVRCHEELYERLAGQSLRRYA
jgi:glycosyltransferase involved in cell wall biosynthesis